MALSNFGCPQMLAVCKDLDSVWIWFYKGVAPMALRTNMIAAFLKTVDGDFDYGAIFGSIIFIIGISINVWILRGAVKRRKIPFGAGSHGSPIIWIERDENPVGYWIVFTLFSLMIGFCVFAIYAMCTGLFHKPD